jgi:hypothetical protein
MHQVLVLGSGGREHALAYFIAQSKLNPKVFIAPGNAGTALVGTNLEIDITDFEAIKQVIIGNKISLIIPGSEQTLVSGIVDFLKADELTSHIPIIGPDAYSAQLEGSKKFSKELMLANGIPTAGARTFSINDIEDIQIVIAAAPSVEIHFYKELITNKNITIVQNDTYNYSKLHDTVKQIVYNINRVIEITYYPTPECKHTNLSDRPMGIGVQGIADLFHMLKLSYSSQESIELEQNIMETIYHASLEASNELAIKYGKYSYFDGSDLSKGIFHYEYYNVKPRIYNDWDTLRNKIKEFGVRNSLMIALMPTASTSQILGNNECFEPITSNIYTRRTSAGEFIIVNKYLIKELIDLNIWTEEMREQLIINDGSVQAIKNIPDDIKERYRTVWEIKMKDIINHAISRQAYVDQSQSMNLFTPVNDASKLTSALLYGWKNGLKTGMYYLRTLPASQAMKFSIDASKVLDASKLKDTNSKPKPKIFEEEEVCINCSS